MRSTWNVFVLSIALGLPAVFVHAQPCEPDETQKVLAVGDYYGDGYGVVAVDGDTAVVGAPSDHPAFDWGGRAYVLERTDGTWMQVAELRARDGVPGDQFGGTVAISGNTIMVGASHHDDITGAVYVFEKPEGGWHSTFENCTLVANDGDEGDGFGPVAVSGDIAVIGASADEQHGDYSGSAYVFERDNDCWHQTAKLDFVSQPWTYFGQFVDIQDQTIVVSAYAGGEGSSHPGSTYVFQRIDGAWTLVAELTSSDGAGADSFGAPVALSADGSVIVCGAGWDDNENGTEAGAAYVFNRPDDGWQTANEDSRIINDEEAREGERFGSAVDVAVVDDVVVLGIGAYTRDLDGAEDAGAAYVYEFLESSWRKRAMLTASDYGANDRLGYKLALSGDTMLVGAYSDDNENGQDAGAVYVFDLDFVGACWRDPAWVCDGDVDGDGQVNPVDVGIIQAHFGSEEDYALCNYDLDCDGQINPVDSGIVQALFGTCDVPRCACR